MSNKELDDMFRQAYGQSCTPANEIPQNRRKDFQKRQVTSEKYSEFLRKYADLEKYIDTFKPMDLTYFFREKSRDTGNFYRISNMKRDMGIFKKLLLDYDAVTICTMIEFLFESGQTYLPTIDLQPTVLNSSWCTRIYADMLKWVNDEFDPNMTEKKKYKISSAGAERNKKREWQRKSSGVTIGDWGDE